MENKGLRVNTKKTKLMVTGPRLDVLLVHFRVLSVGTVLEHRTQSSTCSALTPDLLAVEFVVVLWNRVYHLCTLYVLKGGDRG